MKLRNKKTGEAVILIDHIFDNYESLAELNEEWEDYEEPKGNWTIGPMNEGYIDDGKYTAPDELERYEELGLKFNTKEEAEKAVEKLKAWKRLKDAGFKFNGVYKENSIDFIVNDISNQTESDLNLLFGGEE